MIIDIIKNKQKTLIFGDYDVDGISSITILSSFFRHLNHPFKYVIPDRNFTDPPTDSSSEISSTDESDTDSN